MLTPTSVTPGHNRAAARWGAAARFDFDNPAKWVTRRDVPLLDEHEMTDEAGRPMATVDRAALEEIAANNNRRVVETGDPATLILGHTSDDPRAPEKPAEGFVVNYKVKPFKRDPETGRVIYAIHGDFKVRPKKADILEQYPRRSVELWWNKKELDPVALLGGTTPERDLGAVIRNARFKHMNLRGAAAGGAPEAMIRYSRSGRDVIEEYEIITPKGRHMPQLPGNRPVRYMAGDDNMNPMGGGNDLLDQSDEDTALDDGQGEDDPLVAKVFQSKQWQELSNKLDMILGALEQQSPAGPQEPGMDDGMTLPPGGPGNPPGGLPPGGRGSPPPQGDMADEPDEQDGEPDEEARDEHGEEPVRFGAGTCMPGPGNVNIPTTGGRRKGKYSRTPTPRTNTMPRQPAAPNPELVRMQRRLNDMQMKLSRRDAEAVITELEGEGIVFGDTPEEAAAGRAEEAEFLALLSEDDRNYHVNNVIRKRYKRKDTDPVNTSYPRASLYARPQAGSPEGGEGDDFDPKTPEEASTFADLMTLRKMSRADAIKFMRSRR